MHIISLEDLIIVSQTTFVYKSDKDVVECLWNTTEYVDLGTTSFRIWTAFSLKLIE